MTISFKIETVTVIRAAVVVERGDNMPDWVNATEHPLPGCRLQPMATDEVLFSGSGSGGMARDAVVTRWKLFGPYDADLTALDRVRAGVVYEVDGQVQRWRSPTGRLAHIEVVLRRVDG
jgi:hypothetical protein